MIKEYSIKNIREATELILDQQYQAGIDRIRSNYLFRGMSSSGYRLVTSLFRNCGSRQSFLEPAILKSFAKYAVAEDPQIQSSVWRQMISGQHHGLPTRLLDWSHSSLIAMHFATAEDDVEDTDKRDGVVWRIDAEEISALLPIDYRRVLEREYSNTFTVEELSEVANSTSRYDRDMGERSFVIIEPPSTDQRIINQYSYFSVVPAGIEDLEVFLDRHTENTVRYIIDKSLRWDLRDILDQFNVSERLVYPGLDGLSRWIARHYYVKSSLREEGEQG